MNLRLFIYRTIHCIRIAERAATMCAEQQLFVFQELQILSNGYGRHVQLRAKVHHLYASFLFKLIDDQLMPFGEVHIGAFAGTKLGTQAETGKLKGNKSDFPLKGSIRNLSK